MSSLYTEEEHASVYVCEHWKRGAAGRERRERKRDRHLQAQMSARGTIKVEKKKIRRRSKQSIKLMWRCLGSKLPV
jgi:hypothetical protein